MPASSSRGLFRLPPRPGRRPGMALVVAIMTAFILLALIGTLFLIVATTRHQADYVRQGAIALNLVEAGLADAVYRLNHDPGTFRYPFTPPGGWTESTDNPYRHSRLMLPGTFPRRVSAIMGADPFGHWIRGEIEDGFYHVAVARGTPHRLVSAGEYRGTWRVLSLDLRGHLPTNRARFMLQDPDSGLSEAFNKKAAYARRVTGTPSQGEGNLAVSDECLSDTPAGPGYTMTYLPAARFAPPRPFYSIVLTAEPPSAAQRLTGAGMFADGTVRTVSTVPRSGYRFTGWTEGDTPVPDTPPSNYRFTVGASRDLRANFEAIDEAAEYPAWPLWPLPWPPSPPDWPSARDARFRYDDSGQTPPISENTYYNPGAGDFVSTLDFLLYEITYPHSLGNYPDDYLVAGGRAGEHWVFEAGLPGILPVTGPLTVRVNPGVTSTATTIFRAEGDGSIVVGNGARTGALYARGDIAIGENCLVAGLAYAPGGGITVAPGTVVSGRLYALGDITLEGNARVEGNVHSREGRVSVGPGGEVTGEVLARNQVHLYQGARAGGRVVSRQSSIILADGAEVGGDVLSSTGIYGGDNVTAGARVASRNSTVNFGVDLTAAGTVQAQHLVNIGAGAEIGGMVVSRNAEVTVGAGSEVSGSANRAIDGREQVTVGADSIIRGRVLSREAGITLGADVTVGPVASGDHSLDAHGDITVGSEAELQGPVVSRRGNIVIRHGSSITGSILAWSDQPGAGLVTLGGGGLETVSVSQEVAGRAGITLASPSPVSVNTARANSFPAPLFTRGRVLVESGGTLSVSLGNNQSAAILVDRLDSDDPAAFTLQRPLNPVYPTIIPTAGGVPSAAIVVNRAPGGRARITLNADLGAPGSGRLVYAAAAGPADHFSGDAEIAVSPPGTTVRGSLVSGGTIDLQGPLFYDDGPYLHQNALGRDIYRHFEGGRRSWAVRPGAWRLHEMR